MASGLKDRSAQLAQAAAERQERLRKGIKERRPERGDYRLAADVRVEAGKGSKSSKVSASTGSTEERRGLLSRLIGIR